MMRRDTPLLPAWWNGLVGWLENWGNVFFNTRSAKSAVIVRVVILVGLYFLGIFLWGDFFSWGNISFDFLDWAEVTGPRYSMLQDAANTNQFPLHAANPSGLRGVTDRYLSIADTPLSPQFYLLRFMEMGTFTFINTLLFYTIGYLGLLLIYRKYRLSVWVFALLFLLFSFNGNITTHIAVGHPNWIAQYLLPFLIYLVLVLLEREQMSWGWLLGMAVTLVLILLQGHFHLYVWCLLFLGFLAVFQPKVFIPIAASFLITLLISLPRLLPPVLVLEGVTQEYLGGYASLMDLVNGMVILRDPNQVAAMVVTNAFPLNGWELDAYIGLLGGMMVGWFGLFVPAREYIRQAKGQVDHRIAALLLPSLVMILLSLSNAYELFVRVFTIPPLTGERVTSRFLIVPLSFLLVLAAIYLQRWLDRTAESRSQGRLELWALVGLVTFSLIVLHDLFSHLRTWRIRYLDSLTSLFPKVPFDPAQHLLGNHIDPGYTNLLWGGLVVSVVTLIVVIWMAVRSRKNLKPGT